MSQPTFLPEYNLVPRLFHLTALGNEVDLSNEKVWGVFDETPANYPNKGTRTGNNILSPEVNFQAACSQITWQGWPGYGGQCKRWRCSPRRNIEDSHWWVGNKGIKICITLPNGFYTCQARRKTFPRGKSHVRAEGTAIALSLSIKKLCSELQRSRKLCGEYCSWIPCWLF